jgi:YesN/AraC family two-component response regulator
MFGKKRKLHSKLFFKYLIRFILIIIIILFCEVIFLDKYVIDKFMKIFEENYTDKLNSEITMIDRNIDAIKSTAYQIEMSPSNIPYMLNNNPSYKIDIIDTLKSITSTNLMIDEVALSYKEYDNYLITSGGSMNYSNFTKNYIKSSWDDKRLNEEIKKTNGFRMLMTEDVDHYEIKFLFISSMPSGKTTNYGNVLFLINSDFLVNNIENIIKKYNHFVIIKNEENNNKYIINTTSYNLHNANINDLEDDFMILKANVSNGFNYTVGINKRELYAEIKNIYNISLLILASLTFVGIGLVYLATEMIYQPIKKITQSIDDYDGVSNELNIISNSLDDLVNIKNKNLLIIEDVKQQLYNNLIFHSLYNKNNVMELIDFVNVEFKFKNFNLIKISNNITEEDFNKLYYQLDKSVNNELIHTIDSKDNKILLINTELDNIDKIKKLIVKYNNDILNNKATISIGSIASDIFSINKSYLDASYVLKCGFFNKNNMVLSIKDTLSIVNENYSYPKVKEKNLIASILKGSKKESNRIANCIINKLNSDVITPQISRGIYISIINNIKNSLETTYKLDAYINDINQFLISSNDNISQISTDFMFLIDRFTDLVNSKSNKKQNMLIDKIIQYIDDNHADYTTSLNSIASYVNMSPSYVTKIFRESTTYSIKQYIDIKRIKTAKTLILNTTKSKMKLL